MIRVFFIALILILTSVSVSPQSLCKEKYNYVIITTPEAETILSEFKTWKESLGYSVKIVTTSWISSSYNGGDLEEKIRNFLIEKYREWGINYVLIIGSRNKIPMRLCYPLAEHNGYSPTPTDYYYADLTGNWDKDGDGYFGEYSQDDMDFSPEVYVGRIPIDEPDRIRETCERIIDFERDNGRWKKNVLLIGAIIFYENQSHMNHVWHRSDGATLMEECREDIFEPNGFNITRLYEKEGLKPSIYECEHPLNRSNVLSEWRGDYGIINLLGHANNREVDRLIWRYDDGDNIPEYPGELEYEMFLQYSDGKDLSKEKPPIVFTSGCYQFWTHINMGRYFIEKGAAVAFIGSTGGSWYNISLIWRDERDGGTFSINYYFFYYLINCNQRIGNALYNSKIYYYNQFIFTDRNPEWIFRCYDNLYGFNLYGDPSLGLTTEKVDTKPPEVTIEKPREGYLYLFGRETMQLPVEKAIIIGGIDVKVKTYDENLSETNFYIDGKLRYSTEEETCEWLWNEPVVGRHTIKIVAEDKNSNLAYQEVDVWIFNL